MKTKATPQIANVNTEKKQVERDIKLSDYHITDDSLFIQFGKDVELKFGRDEYNLIVDNHPELFALFPKQPDQSYYSQSITHDFDSEVGQDTYYLLYAYLLKQKNDLENIAEIRKKLITIYQDINTLFQNFEHGGTFFGHQYYRIYGYAEYSIHLYNQTRDNWNKTYDISWQKELYIQGLRQLIEDEVNNDNATIKSEKNDQKLQLNKLVDDLNRNITDIFYLRSAQQFQYSHYTYF